MRSFKWVEYFYFITEWIKKVAQDSKVSLKEKLKMVCAYLIFTPKLWLFKTLFDDEVSYNCIAYAVYAEILAGDLFCDFGEWNLF